MVAPATDAALRKGMPPGWRRHPREPHHAIEHDSGRLRVSKAVILGKPNYTAWLKENADWTRLPGNYLDVNEAIEKAESCL